MVATKFYILTSKIWECSLKHKGNSEDTTKVGALTWVNYQCVTKFLSERRIEVEQQWEGATDQWEGKLDAMGATG